MNEATKPFLPPGRLPLAARIGLSLVGVFVLVSASYGFISWRKSTPSLAHAFGRGTSFQELTSAPAPQAEARPVRFANPFDAREVFEFSPGTTQDAAREAVAEILRKRAMAREKS